MANDRFKMPENMTTKELKAYLRGLKQTDYTYAMMQWIEHGGHKISRATFERL